VDDELTAYENIELHGILYRMEKNLRRSRMEQLLKLLELWDRKDNLVKTFSGGMRRRLEIARGLMHHPKILFLDEPTSGLDAQTRNLMWDYLIDLNNQEGITIFFTTHYLEEAEKVARNIAIIDHGKIVGQGTSTSLKEQTKTKTLEEAYLILTGKSIRAEEATPIDNLRRHSRIWQRNKK